MPILHPIDHSVVPFVHSSGYNAVLLDHSFVRDALPIVHALGHSVVTHVHSLCHIALDNNNNK